MLEQILFIITAFLASAISATIGLGAAMILLPFAAILLPIKQAIAIVTFYFIATAGSKAWLFRQHTDWRLVKLLWLGSIPTVFVGAYLLTQSTSSLIQVVLGLAIVLYVAKEYTGWKATLKPSSTLIIGTGAAYGVLSGLVGDGSLIRAVLLTRMGITKEAFIAAMATSAFLPNVIKAILYSKFSLLTMTDLPLIIFLMIAAILGTYTGKKFINYISEEKFKNGVLIVMLIIAIKLLHNGLFV